MARDPNTETRIVLQRSTYTREQLERELNIPGKVIDQFFPKAEMHTKRQTGKPRQPVWTAAQVRTVLTRRAVQRAITTRRRNLNQLEEIRDYLLSFDIENMRQEAEAMPRRFVLHVGPTNSGKTWQALQVLKAAERGVYLGPLRLLALEVFDTLNRDGVPCHLLTGEESITVGNARHTASTVELADFRAEYDVAVIDEAQMITDASRGDRWMKAIYGIRAMEVHVCLAPEAETLIRGILESFGAAYTVVQHQRLAPLSCGGLFRSLRDTRPGDALIVFSRKAVLATAAELEQLGIHVSVIYGALPPVSRREEVRRFTAGETSAVVATDAIGMGVSLPIRRVIFCEMEKFDGQRRRPLKTGEIKQVAGRAGRYGIYDRGEALTMGEVGLLRFALSCKEKQERSMMVPFPGEAVTSPYPLDILLTVWNTLPRSEQFSRVDMSDALILYRAMGKLSRQMDRELCFSLITCPVDTGSEGMVAYWLACCEAIHRGMPLPEPPSGFGTLEQCEARYRELDIRHQLLRRIGVEEDRMAEKQELCETINRYLKADRLHYLRHCSVCGRHLPATWPHGVCQGCFARRQQRR